MKNICLCTFIVMIGVNQVRIDSPFCPIHATPKIEIDSMVLCNIMRSAADSLQVASAKGLKTVYVSREMTLRNFMRYCLGTDELGGATDEN